MSYQIIAGFLPLLDSAILVAAREKGFATQQGVDLVLMRENSWASVRDRLAVGHFNVAHMLAPMPIACNLGLTPLATRTIAPMALGLGGNAVTVSSRLWAEMRERGASGDFDPHSTGAALAATVAERHTKGLAPLRFAVVHPFSGHNYELRYWLAASGVNPATEIEIIIVPPPLMADALQAGQIDGYCVGEPWNTAAAARDIGRIVTTKARIWRSSPEKVLGAAANWAENNRPALDALLRSMHLASVWCGNPANHPELASILSLPAYVGCPAEWLLPALSGRMIAGDGDEVAAPDFFLPLARAATFPWRSHALWFYSQMVRWGQIEANTANEAIARETYRPDIYRAALGELDVALPGANSKMEGALTGPTPVGSAGASLVLGPDGFFDGRIFDPDDLAGYLAGLSSID